LKCPFRNGLFRLEKELQEYISPYRYLDYREGQTLRIILAAICLFTATALNAQNLRDFTGTWRVDPSKTQEKATPKNPPSNAPEIPPPPPHEHKYTPEQIHQSGDMLEISGGEAGTTAVYTIDLSGKEVSDPIPDAPGSIRIATALWDDGKPVTEWKMQGTVKLSCTAPMCTSSLRVVS
jgi:hypothetical protein